MESNYLKRIEPWYEPADQIREKISFQCEMSREDHGFLCGAIRQSMPKKIVEIGVAEGGTTCVIMNCLKILSLDSIVYSVDLTEKLYYDVSLNTGYEYEKLKNMIGIKGTHKLLVGKTIAGQINTVGADIDLVIIDTTHRLPGELLDFLAVLPYVSPGAMIVLHDVNLNCIRTSSAEKNVILKSREDIASKVLFMTVVADKYINRNENNITASNIAAVSVTEDTYQYVASLFFALTLTWSYLLSDQVIQEYRELLEENYSAECIKWFDLAVKCNQYMTRRIHIAATEEDCLSERFRFPNDKIPKGSKIILYGAGHVGKEMRAYLKKTKYCTVVAWLDKKCGGEVKAPQELSNKTYDYILVSVEKKTIFDEIKHEILQNTEVAEDQIIGPVERY